MIVGVHGIAQQQLGPEQLLSEWHPALRDGVWAALGTRPPDLRLVLGFYGNVFLKDSDWSTKGDALETLLVGLTDDEIGDLQAAALEVLSPGEIEVASSKVDKGVPGIPGVLAAVLRAFDQRFGLAAGVLYLGELRQVRKYLTDPGLKARVDEIVAEAMARGARVLVGHSLGSVVAYEYARQHPEADLPLLVTLGSPLSLRMVRSHLPDHIPGPGTIPPNVHAWVNVRDVRDPVALGGDLRDYWPGVDDRHVDNGWKDPHNACSYLGKSQTGSAIAEILGLGSLS